VGERGDYRQTLAYRQQIVAKGLKACVASWFRYLPEKSSRRQFAGPFVTKFSPKSLLFSGG
jgi:HEPN domain-containing protein